MRHPLSRVTYAFNEAIQGRDTLYYFNELKKIRNYSEDELKVFQFERLKKLLVYACNHTDYYKKAFDKAGFDPANMTSFENFQKTSLLTKSDIRNDATGFIANDKKRKLTRYATSGSTGHPLIFYLSNERTAAAKAAYLVLYDWWGLGIGDREAVLWGSSRDISAYSIAKKIRDRLLNTHLLPAFAMGEKTMQKYIDFIRKYRPKDIFGYAHSIYILARFAKNRGVSLKDAGVKVIFTTAEALHDFQRELIQEAFGCPVANCYGGRESGLIAFECPAGGMHLNPNIITEIVKDGVPVKPGDKGEIVITDLDSYGMPFIRYRTGDEGILSAKPCACGRTSAVMEKVLGRNTDYVVNAKGEFIHPLALEYIFRELAGVDYFKITQKKEDKLVIDLVVNQKFDKSLERHIKDKVCQAMNGPVDVDIRFIKEDEIDQGDKYKFVVSEVIGKYI